MSAGHTLTRPWQESASRRGLIAARRQTKGSAMPSSKSVVMNAKVITEGLAFGESPRWHDGRLWVCNWGTGEIVAVSEEGESEVVLTVPAILPYSIDWLPDGRLLIVSGQEGLLLRQEADGTVATH